MSKQNETENQDHDMFDVFEDRVVSLLERWRNFKNKGADPKASIRACLQEINDEYTQGMIREE